MFYTNPESLAAEITELESKVRQFKEGRLEGAVFKAHRVPFGVYEQRQDNTYMVRIRTPGGAVTPRQLRTVAELSKKFGSGSIHVTTRQELQIHDVKLDDVISIMRELLPVGLSTRGGGGNTVRNIIGSAESGVAVDEIFDILPYVSALTSRLVAEPDSWLLPRKYKIAFSNSSTDTSHATFNDLGFIAKIKNGLKGFEVYVAGGMGTKPQVGNLLYDFVAETKVYFIAEAVKRLFNKHGNRKNRHAARLRFLWNNLGETKFQELFQQELETLHKENALPLSLPAPLAPSLVPAILPFVDTSPEFELWRKRYVTAQKQAGIYSVLIPIFLGNLSNDKAIALADFLAPFGEDVVRATIEQNLLLRNIPESLLGNVHAVVKEISDLVSESKFLASVVACTGASTCKLGICLPRGAIAATAKKLKNSGLDLDRLSGFHLNISGCPNTCGAHMTADLGFFGKVLRKGQTLYPAYGIVAGAKISAGKSHLAEPVGEVSARDLPAFIEELLRDYLDKQSYFSGYSEYLEKSGKPFIKSWSEAHCNIPDFEDDKNYYYDWSATDVFSLADRGVAECSAGLFDLIDVDIKRIKKLRADLAALSSGPLQEQVFYQLALSAARMLLIVRAVEAKAEDEVFVQFRRLFILTGLVDSKFVSLIDLAEKKDIPAVAARSTEVLALAQTMEELYGKMDNSLHFPKEMAKPASATSVPGDRKTEAIPTHDFREVACPMNFVKTKLALENLTSGQKLKVLLDDGTPIQNVPRSVAAEGHKILEQTREGVHWSILIQKG